ncbi:DUF485 domain-containing protein [Helicobacter heilmannii]|uniref:Putative membrane protein, clustering with ActP n=1 Tax=Helicobacter heilmannii TaxID=35817 RepID=A0A0K2Y8V9_HELHE|nr:DUF485 domain-containing protein [Helicobacter heilmannii]CCM11063.1 hypothetical protein BN341_10810 [Helicobacter heilmannii ASB1.4]CCM73544.1 hypothetical protein BN341_10820 [Helicobacter heilmannii ASB1.4]CRF46645.1 hypothetical protein HHE014_16600 [Helicobacter heilmannii]CRF48419.1 hypothetical protein HHE02_17440 [Helicobacter heilmannii]CRF49330.1 hypothetical protein HHE03_09380 [Helicobacter heilmannii]
MEKVIAEFRAFVALRQRVSWVLAGVVFVCYYLFVLGIGLFPQVLAYRLGPSAITLGIVAGMFLIVLCIALTGIYTFLANEHFDTRQAQILDKLKESGALQELQNGTHGTH